MFKLIALDIDGTLIDNNRQITPITKKTIKIALAQGYLVTLNTGRSFHSAKKYADQLQIKLPIITANGAMIRDANTMEILKLTNFKKSVSQKIAKLLDKQRDIVSQGYHSEGIITSGLGILGLVRFSNNSGGFSIRKLKEYYEEYKLCNIKRRRSLVKGIVDTEIHKFFVASRAETSKQLEEMLQKYDCIVESHYEGVNGYLEIIPKGVSKGEGLKYIARHCGVDISKTIAMGDSANDVSMFKVAGLPVAMANGTEYAKSHAKHITFSNNDDGVAAVVKEFMLTPVKDFKFAQKTGS
ncbi:HAD family phosphatase [Alkalicella caledoniensis]|uniref:HAD family phosphatase n=1 Tax=Alkalicella caledoniensis TaxID=2731377 RepID=A0A7G9W764_ALKCA|nr:Cof-type HAD-IIB family hydrolase [Alkalicella caledoniensis]QNO14526.1 HAD family phosphatase [Alkalicella caledoniensis]